LTQAKHKGGYNKILMTVEAGLVKTSNARRGKKTKSQQRKRIKIHDKIQGYTWETEGERSKKG